MSSARLSLSSLKNIPSTMMAILCTNAEMANRGFLPNLSTSKTASPVKTIWKFMTCLKRNWNKILLIWNLNRGYNEGWESRVQSWFCFEKDILHPKKKNRKKILSSFFLLVQILAGTYICQIREIKCIFHKKRHSLFFCNQLSTCWRKCKDKLKQSKNFPKDFVKEISSD